MRNIIKITSVLLGFSMVSCIEDLQKIDFNILDKNTSKNITEPPIKNIEFIIIEKIELSNGKFPPYRYFKGNKGIIKVSPLLYAKMDIGDTLIIEERYLDTDMTLDFKKE